MKTETKRRVAACAAGFALPRYAELPQVGLYLDQTVQYVNSCYRTFCGMELTPSMVSNYVKKGILPHPVKKKYSRDQIASLLYIAASKTVLSLENIDTLFKMQRAHCSAGAAYDYFCEEMENSATLPWTPRTKSCFCAAPFFRRQTRCIWTAASTPCGRKRCFGTASCRIWRKQEVFLCVKSKSAGSTATSKEITTS